jgi:hypothetical protein
VIEVYRCHALRDLILARLRASRSAGLGEEQAMHHGAGWTPAHVAVLREIRDALGSRQ